MKRYAKPEAALLLCRRPSAGSKIPFNSELLPASLTPVTVVRMSIGKRESMAFRLFFEAQLTPTGRARIALITALADISATQHNNPEFFDQRS